MRYVIQVCVPECDRPIYTAHSHSLLIALRALRDRLDGLANAEGSIRRDGREVARAWTDAAGNVDEMRLDFLPLPGRFAIDPYAGSWRSVAQSEACAV